MLVEAQSSLAGEMDFVYYVYPDNYCSPSNLRLVLDNLRCKPDDVVFFYYSGHGTRSLDDTSRFPQMCLAQHDESKMIPLEGVDRALARLNPRLRFVIADCCNSTSEYVTPKMEISKGNSVVTVGKEVNYRKLFLNQCGNLLMSSSRAGEVSVCNTQIGGYFTYSLLSVLEEAIRQNVSDWNLIMGNAQASTINVSSGRMHPVFDLSLSDTPPAPVQSVPAEGNLPAQVGVATQDPLLPDLLRLVDTSVAASGRLELIDPILHRHFANGGVRVEALGRDSRTVVNSEGARNFLERLATSFNLVNFNILTVKRNEGGKITYLGVHEVYRL